MHTTTLTATTKIAKMNMETVPMCIKVQTQAFVCGQTVTGVHSALSADLHVKQTRTRQSRRQPISSVSQHCLTEINYGFVQVGGLAPKGVFPFLVGLRPSILSLLS